MTPRFSTIVGLLFPRSPFAVRWLIVPIVVLSLQCFTLGAFSHVFKKYGKGIEPTFAHGYPSASVIGIPAVIRVCCSHFSAIPRPKLSGDFSNSCHAVNRFVFSSCLNSETSAGAYFSTFQMVFPDVLLFAASAKAIPNPVFFILHANKTDNRQICYLNSNFDFHCEIVSEMSVEVNPN